jgi:hypothetical protein
MELIQHMHVPLMIQKEIELMDACLEMADLKL